MVDAGRAQDWPLQRMPIGPTILASEPYLACVDTLSVSPQSCLFIDDMHVNCSGAEAVGMQSYWFDVRDPEGSLAGLMSRLGL